MYLSFKYELIIKDSNYLLLAKVTLVYDINDTG